MISKLTGFFVYLLFAITIVQAIEIAGTVIPDSLIFQEDDCELILNGAGLRKKFGFKVYAGGLYLQTSSSDSQRIIDADEPMAISMTWLRNVDADAIIETFTDGFNYAAGDNHDVLQENIQSFLDVLGSVSKSDIWKLTYHPGKGTSVFNGDRRLILIPGLEFKIALFGIWLLETDAFKGDKALRNGMLGK